MTSLSGDRDLLTPLVREELQSTRDDVDSDSVEFLASGEYTLNFRVTLDRTDAVLRIITGSQMGLETFEQARYEARALDLLAPTSRVPRLIGAGLSPVVLDYPYLLMSYIPGRPLDYDSDLELAASCIAGIHQFPVPAGHDLQVHYDPVASILDESAALQADLHGREWAGVRAFFRRVEATPASEFAGVRSDQVIVNTDLNPHNFIVGDDRIWLIDWEKVRIAPSILDVAHFLLPTTTLWRDSTAACLTGMQRELFIRAYLDARSDLEPHNYRAALDAGSRLVALRAISWCAWAVDASRREARGLEHAETLAKCQRFTSSGFLEELEAELWR